MGRPARARGSPTRSTDDTTPANPSEDMEMVPSSASDWSNGRRRGLRSQVPRAPERARRIASWARSRRHGEEWLWAICIVKASVCVWVCIRVRALSLGQDLL